MNKEMDSWSIVKVSTDEILSRLRLYLAILMMTRSIKHFNSFNLATIDKAFKWGDSLSLLTHTADNVQLNLVSKSITTIGIPFIDNMSDKVNLLLNPIDILIQVIMGSPLLSSIKNGDQIIRECLIQSTKRIGKDRTLDIASSTIKDTIVNRLIIVYSNNFISSKKLIYDNDNHDSNKHYSNNSITFELLHVCYKLQKKGGCPDGAIPIPSINKIRVKAANDIVTLHMLCRALVLDPFELAICITTNSNNLLKNDTDDESITTSTTTTSNLPLLEMVERYQKVASSSQLWDIVRENVVDDIGRMLVIDNDCNTLHKMACKRKDVYELLIEQLNETISNITTVTGEEGDNDESLPQVLEKLLHDMTMIQGWQLPYDIDDIGISGTKEKLRGAMTKASTALAVIIKENGCPHNKKRRKETPNE